MKISKRTLAVLNNFSQINGDLLFNLNNCGKLTTKNKGESFLAFYDLPDEEKNMPEFGIYELAKLNTLLNEFKSEKEFEIDFKDDRLLIKGKLSRLNYYYSTPSLLQQPPTKTERVIDKYDIEFNLSPDTFKKFLKMSAILSVEILKIECIDNKIYGIINNKNKPDSNSFKLFLGKNTQPFNGDISFGINNWKLIQDFTYNVKVINNKAAILEALEEVEAGEFTPVGLTYVAAPIKVF